MHWLENENYFWYKTKALIYLLELPPIHLVTIVEGNKWKEAMASLVLTHPVSDSYGQGFFFFPPMDNKSIVVILSIAWYCQVWQSSVPLLNVFDQVIFQKGL